MKKIILLFCLLLLISGTVSANPVVIEGVGQIELAPNITVTEFTDKKGELNYSFRALDGNVWRGAMIMPISKISNTDYINIFKIDAVLDRMINEKFSKSKDVLSTEKAKLMTLGGKECATATAKMSIINAGMVINMDMTIISGSDGVKMFAFMCADSDAQYWRPVMQKILVAIP